MNQRRVLQAALRDSLGATVQAVFQTICPGAAFLPNWHIAAIVHELMEIERGDNRRLIINQPPRSLKSICVSIAYVAWKLGHDPGTRIVVVSYSADLAADLHRLFRLVVDSRWYRETFPKVRVAKDTGDEFITTVGGGRVALSVGGSFTGRGADIVIIDDPQKEDDAFSETPRKRAIEWITGTLFSRLNDKARTPVILVQQRLHEEDVSGYLLSQGNWRHLNLSAIAPAREEVPIGRGRFHIREEGEALHPERESLETLAEVRRDKGTLLFSAHFLQAPVPAEGNLIRRNWFKLVDDVPERRPGVQVVQSWDIASAIGDRNDYSVCLSFHVKRDDYYLAGVWRGRLEFPDLRRKIIDLGARHQANTILIEDAGAGQSLLQEFQHKRPPGMIRPIGIKPLGSKVDRMNAQSAQIEAGHVHLVKDADWLPDLLHELLAFPHGRHDDQLDALSQFLHWARFHGRYSGSGGAPRIID
ncbi:phage terminase large subunit [Bauldia litoralis]|uniref:phage terminase large subunit n=1 Tax=Bauldia litoralis TaxID=665467 RepID=UPI003266266E